MIPQANQIYRHFKGNLYRVITIAVHTETEEEMVVYQALYGDFKVYVRPLQMFCSEVDKEKYPDVTQKFRFEPIEQMVEVESVTVKREDAEAVDVKREETENIAVNIEEAETVSVKMEEQENVSVETQITEECKIDPLLEAYLDTDSYREKLNILHGLQHRITEHMLTTMAVVIDFELPEGDIQTKYDALNDCLVTKEK